MSNPQNYTGQSTGRPLFLCRRPAIFCIGTPLAQHYPVRVLNALPDSNNMRNKPEHSPARCFRFLAAASSLICATAFFFGCASSRPGCDVLHRSISIAQPFDAVWPAVLQAAAKVSTNVTAERTMGSVQADEVALHEPWFPITAYACQPSGVFTEWGTSRMTIKFTVLPKSSNETQVTVACRFYRFSTAAGDAWRRWPSNGRFEQQLLSNVVARASQ